MLRCIHTSIIAFEESQVLIEIHPNIYEKGGMFNRGEVFTGPGKLAILEKFPSVNAEKVPNEGYYFSDSVETTKQAWNRAQSFIDELKTLKYETICITTHALFLDIIFAILNQETIETRNFNLDAFHTFHNCGISLIE